MVFLQGQVQHAGLVGHVLLDRWVRQGSLEIWVGQLLQLAQVEVDQFVVLLEQIQKKQEEEGFVLLAPLEEQSQQGNVEKGQGHLEELLRPEDQDLSLHHWKLLSGGGM